MLWSQGAENLSPRSTILICFLTFFSFLEYVESVFRGTKQLKLAEARMIAQILRREYPKLFVLTDGNLNLRYSCAHKFMPKKNFQNFLFDFYEKKKKKVNICIQILKQRFFKIFVQSLSFGSKSGWFWCAKSGTSVVDPAGMFIPDPTFFHPGSELFPSRIRIKEFKSIF